MIDRALLFGSHAKGDSQSFSDIDLALTSNSFEGIRFLDKQTLNPFLIHFDSRLEVHPYKTSEFNEQNDWFIKEIVGTGITIK